MFGYIYKTTCLINNKIYIGKHSKNRLNYYGSGKYFKNALKKYGKDNFKKEILEYCDSIEELDKQERYWVLKLNPILNKTIGYNLAFPNGTNGGHQFTDETKQKISDHNAWKGKHLSKETRQKLSKAHKGKHSSKETRQKMSEHSRWKGKHRSEETRQKISRSNTGKHLSEEARQKISKSNTGKHLSKETRQKMSKSKKGQIPWNKGKKKSQK